MHKTLLLAATAALLTTGHAWAHARLLHAAPKVGETVRGSPAELRLWFSESIDLPKSSVTLAGPAGPVAIGRLGLDPKSPRVVVAPLPRRLAPGAYHVTWGMTSLDTHHTDGDFMFKVAP
ncbi:MAG TPA: copper resistance protein CopC [Phenylobacterium sp.]|jgi:hypothetical protein|nr:copper resistance protein CopC [Phenylobacterium sp.]